MSAVAVWLGLAALIASVMARPHGRGPIVGSALALAIASAGGAVGADDLGLAIAAQWRAYVTLASVMTMTSAAERLGLLERLAGWIEPRTRGPVRHAFLVTFALSALAAAVLSNDAAVLLLTPAVLALLRTVYPRRHPKFLAPFAFAVFAGAGVAPFVISNPMNLIFADHVGLGFNAYAATMIPVAIASWLATYAMLARCFRGELADDSPALGAWPMPPPLAPGARAGLWTIASVLALYPIVSFAGAPVWPVALAGAAVCLGASACAGAPPRALAGGVTWSVFPFLAAVYVLALGLERTGVVEHLARIYDTSPMPTATIGATAALGSAVLNNHPMSVLDAFALDRMHDPSLRHAFAALIGGDLGPRLLPVGSLASLLWFDVLHRHGVRVRVRDFVRVGVAITAPVLLVSLLALAWVR